MKNTKNVQPNQSSVTKCKTSVLLSSGLIISVNEAKKILGIDSQGVCDDEIVSQLFLMSELAQILIKYKHFNRE